MGKDVPLSKIFDPADKRYGEGGEFRALYESDADVRKVVDTAKGLEGLKRQWGVHAAGVIMSSEPLLDVIPIMRREQDGAIITQFDYPDVRAPRLIKMDFLGLRNLTVLDDALLNIKSNRDEVVVLEDLELADDETFELMAKGETLGVFQLDGGPDARPASRMKPDSFSDISAVGALYRPGPMGANAHNKYANRKNGREPIEPLHPELAEPLAEILAPTVRADRLPGAGDGDPAEAGGLLSSGKATCCGARWARRRRPSSTRSTRASATACSPTASPPPRQGAVGHPGPVLRLRVQQVAHGGLRADLYWTAYLKAHYPAEYMAALLTSVGDSKDRMAPLPERVPPDGHQRAAARRQRLRRRLHRRGRGHPLRAARGPQRGHQRRRRDRGGREEKGKFSDFSDFMDKVPAIVCQKKVVESLAKAGAFDSLGHGRRALVAIHEDAVDQHADIKRNEAIGQDSLFGGLDDADFGSMTVQVPDIPDWDKQTLLGFEREMLGLYVSSHPLMGLEHVLSASAGLHDRCPARRRVRADNTPSRSAGSSPPCSARSPGRATPGRSSPWRTSKARSTSCCFRRPTSWPRRCWWRTPSSSSRAGCGVATTCRRSVAPR
jgi:DNA polymerase-3 subunit alpha